MILTLSLRAAQVGMLRSVKAARQATAQYEPGPITSIVVPTDHTGLAYRLALRYAVAPIYCHAEAPTRYPTLHCREAHRRIDVSRSKHKYVHVMIRGLPLNQVKSVRANIHGACCLSIRSLHWCQFGVMVWRILMKHAHRAVAVRIE